MMKLILKSQNIKEFVKSIQVAKFKDLIDHAKKFVEDNKNNMPKVKFIDPISVLAAIMHNAEKKGTLFKIKKGLRQSLSRFFDNMLNKMYTLKVLKDTRKKSNEAKKLEKLEAKAKLQPVNINLNNPLLNQSSSNNLSHILLNQTSSDSQHEMNNPLQSLSDSQLKVSINDFVDKNSFINELPNNSFDNNTNQNRNIPVNNNLNNPLRNLSLNNNNNDRIEVPDSRNGLNFDNENNNLSNNSFLNFDNENNNLSNNSFLNFDNENNTLSNNSFGYNAKQDRIVDDNEIILNNKNLNQNEKRKLSKLSRRSIGIKNKLFQNRNFFDEDNANDENIVHEKVFNEFNNRVHQAGFNYVFLNFN
jgi:hypothetical protein